MFAELASMAKYAGSAIKGWAAGSGASISNAIGYGAKVGETEAALSRMSGLVEKRASRVENLRATQGQALGNLRGAVDEMKSLYDGGSIYGGKTRGLPRNAAQGYDAARVQQSIANQQKVQQAILNKVGGDPKKLGTLGSKERDAFNAARQRINNLQKYEGLHQKVYGGGLTKPYMDVTSKVKTAQGALDNSVNKLNRFRGKIGLDGNFVGPSGYKGLPQSTGFSGAMKAWGSGVNDFISKGAGRNNWLNADAGRALRHNLLWSAGAPAAAGAFYNVGSMVDPATFQSNGIVKPALQGAWRGALLSATHAGAGGFVKSELATKYTGLANFAKGTRNATVHPATRGALAVVGMADAGNISMTHAVNQIK